MATNIGRAGRKVQILEVLKADKKCRTTHELANLCGMKQSPHFRKIVYELHQECKIKGIASRLRNGRMAYFWCDLSVNLDTQLELF